MENDQKIKNVEMVLKLIESFPEPRRTQVKKMMDDLGELYFTSPASSRKDGNHCYPGGLCQHSLNTVLNLSKLSKSLCPNKYQNNTISFVGLFHDLGKIGDGVNERYIQNESDWHINKGILYDLNKNCIISFSDASLFILQKYNIEMNFEEWMAIRLGYGQYDDNNKPYKLKEPTLALLLHWANTWSYSLEKNKKIE